MIFRVLQIKQSIQKNSIIGEGSVAVYHTNTYTGVSDEQVLKHCAPSLFQFDVVILIFKIHRLHGVKMNPV